MNRTGGASPNATESRPRLGGSGRDVWDIPWRGGSARLAVKTVAAGGQLRAYVDGIEVARTARATLDVPWVELELPGAVPSVVVAQMQVRRYSVRTMVFVSRFNIEDGLSLDSWREKSPAPIDRFEQAFMGPWFGPLGAVVVGAIAALPFLVELTRTSNPSWAPWAVGGFLLGSGWIAALAKLIHWLAQQEYWPWRLRRLVVVFAVVGLPFALVLLLQALTAHN